MKNSITMEYPTWKEVSRFLNVGDDAIKPEDVYGDTAFESANNNNPPSSWKGDNYKQELVGIDIPVLLKPNNANKNIIVILGESPLRNDKNRIAGQNIIFGLPYAVHMDENSPSQSKVYKKIFKGLMDKGYSIYLTDIIKDWYKERTLNPNANEIKLLKKELEILDKQYKIIKIVAFGKRAEGAINKLKIVDPHNIIYIPHPSKTNWVNWKLKIFEEAVYSGNLQYATSKYPNVNDSTNEDIVSEEALNLISKGL